MKKNKISYQNLIKYSCGILNNIGLDEFSLNAVANGLCETSLSIFMSFGR